MSKPIIVGRASDESARHAGQIKQIEEDVRKREGELKEQGQQIAALIAKEPFLATKEWVYVSFLKYIVPSMLLLIGLAFTYLVRFNENIMRAIINKRSFLE